MRMPVTFLCRCRRGGHLGGIWPLIVPGLNTAAKPFMQAEDDVDRVFCLQMQPPTGYAPVAG